ncbi:hypothetical protein KI387_028414, partial [Taxus chinensis]
RSGRRNPDGLVTCPHSSQWKNEEVISERQEEYIVQKTDNPKAQILYEDIGHGNYMIMSEDEVKDPKGVINDPNGVW